MQVTKFRYRIEENTDASNPRTEFTPMGKMVCWHNRYKLGDEQPNQDVDEWLYELAGYKKDSYELDEFPCTEQMLKRIKKNYIILPLYLHDHSGITMNTTGFNCRYPSGQVGFIYLSKEDARNEYKSNWVKRAKEYLVGEVKTYDAYISGDVYGYVIESYYIDKDGEEIVEDDHYKSCWGFYGQEYCEEQAKEVVKHLNSPENQFKMAEKARIDALLGDDSCEVFANNFATV